MSMTASSAFDCWLAGVMPDDRPALQAMDSVEREDAFWRELVFGTGGMRGKLGLGPNRMNAYTVGRVTQGLANWLKSSTEKPTVALCRDTRRGSEEFVRRTASVLAANGIHSFIYERVEPTPALSFAVRELGCSAGVVITASHNPAVYNGYKVYGADGCQITVTTAKAIQAAVNAVDSFESVKAMPYDKAVERGLVKLIDERVLEKYIALAAAQSTGEDLSSLCVAYTPLHGVGLECVSEALAAAGVTNMYVADEQAIKDGDFPTCPKPNPEESDALELCIGLGNRVGADVLLATDPDCDRLRVVVRHAGEYKALSGDEFGLLLLEHMVHRAEERGEDLSRKVACTTVVTHPMADDLARVYGFELRRTLTGFKYIGEQIGLLESQGREGDFLVGIEESLGYLSGTNVRDKCGVTSCVLACCVTSRWKTGGLDLVDAIDLLYDRFGYWAQCQVSKQFDGQGGVEAMSAIMSRLRRDPPKMLAGLVVKRIIDYAVGAQMPVVNPSGPAPQTLPPSNVLEMRLIGGSRVIIRPSGTEPKIKSYVFAKSSTPDAASRLLRRIESEMAKVL